MIRKAKAEDLAQIMQLYEIARESMRNSGNPTQWRNGYPSLEIIKEDIANGNFYVEETDGELSGCFAFIIGDEPTYRVIEGLWPDDNPYGTIHRLASNGKTHGVGQRCIAFCHNLIDNLRADTHQDNRKMQQVLLNAGFKYCGIIHVADGTPRLAYQLRPHDYRGI